MPLIFSSSSSSLSLVDSFVSFVSVGSFVSFVSVGSFVSLGSAGSAGTSAVKS